MKIVIHPRFESAADFIGQIPALFSKEGELLHDGRNKLKRFRVKDEVWVVKKYKRPNWIQRIVYSFLKKSKPERAYLFAGMLRERDFDTPHEIAYLEQKRCGLFVDGYFISLNCDYPAVAGMMRKKDFHRPLADALARFLVDLHSKGVLHGDLNLTNILYHVDETGHYCFTLIDTNRSLFKSPTRSECLENLKRLTHNKALLRYVVLRYAVLRGWSPDECTLEVLRYLLRFEQKRRRKRRLQSWVGIKK